MAIFGEEGQVELRSLSDEDIYGADIPTEGERQDDKTQPQDEPTEVDGGEQVEAPAETNQPQAEGEEQLAEPETAPGPGQAVPPVGEVARLNQQYAELRRWATQLAMENGDLKRQLAPRQPQAQAQTQPQVVAQPQADKKAILRNLLENPDAMIGQVVEQRVQEALRPIMQAREREQLNKNIGVAIEDVSSGWSQVKDEAGRVAMVRKMVELSATDGDPNAWQKDPSKYAIAACRNLWGWPVRVDTTAVEAAREAGLREARGQQLNKEGLSVNQPANKQTAPAPSPEEQILAEMRSAPGGGLFG